MHRLFPLKITSSASVGLEVSSLDNHLLVGFPLNTILPLNFFVVFFSRISISLLKPPLIMWYQLFNKYRLKESLPIRFSVSFVSASDPSCSNFLNLLRTKYMCAKLARFSIVVFLKSSINIAINYTIC